MLCLHRQAITERAGPVKVASSYRLLAADCVQSLIAFRRPMLGIWRERFWLSHDFDGTLTDRVYSLAVCSLFEYNERYDLAAGAGWESCRAPSVVLGRSQTTCRLPLRTSGARHPAVAHQRGLVRV